MEGAISAPDSAEPGETITVAVGSAGAGDTIGLWLFSEPVYLGAQTVDAGGNVTVTIPADIEEGAHKIAAWAAETEDQLGWDTLSITVAEDDDDSDAGADGAAGTGGSEDAGDAGDGQNGGSDDGQRNDLADTGAVGSGIAATALAALLLMLGVGAILVRRRNLR